MALTDFKHQQPKKAIGSPIARRANGPSSSTSRARHKSKCNKTARFMFPSHVFTVNRVLQQTHRWRWGTSTMSRRTDWQTERKVKWSLEWIKELLWSPLQLPSIHRGCSLIPVVSQQQQQRSLWTDHYSSTSSSVDRLARRPIDWLTDRWGLMIKSEENHNCTHRFMKCWSVKFWFNTLGGAHNIPAGYSSLRPYGSSCCDGDVRWPARRRPLGWLSVSVPGGLFICARI